MKPTTLGLLLALTAMVQVGCAELLVGAAIGVLDAIPTPAENAAIQQDNYTHEAAASSFPHLSEADLAPVAGSYGPAPPCCASSSRVEAWPPELPAQQQADAVGSLWREDLEPPQQFGPPAPPESEPLVAAKQEPSRPAAPVPQQVDNERPAR